VSGLSRPAQVLALLLEAGGEVSGEEMGRRLGCSRAAVGKAVAALRDQGFAITARTRRGYRLEAEPEAVLPARVEARLAPASLGRPVLHYPSLDSTNLEARRRAEAGAPHGACVVAEHQTAGRGRLDRRWVAPPGACLLFSLLLRAHLALEQAFALTSLAAVALCRALESHGLPVAIKWPNDVFLEGRKLAGILTEFVSRAETVEQAVVGVGLNVNLTPAQLSRLPAPAASLRAATGAGWDRAALLAEILDCATGLWDRARAHGWQEVAAEYDRRFWLAGRRVSVRQGHRLRTGTARGVDQAGALLLEESPGRTARIIHGDVSVLSVD
jgi:BirA family biotin operon repressor/biotin-[acetyl-CoA-carboxylase] ligase